MRPLQSAFSFTFFLAVHSLSAECGSVFADLALYLAVGGLCLGGAFLLSFTLVLQARLAPIPRLPILAVWSFSRSLSLSLKLVCCRLEICTTAPGD